MPEHLTRRGSMWRFHRRVPNEYAHLDTRGIVQESTKIRVADDPRAIRAGQAATRINAALEAYWHALAEGKNSDAHQQYEQARTAARKLNITPPIDDPAQRTIAELLHRIQRLEAGGAVEDRPAALAALDLAPRTAMTFRQCAKAYIAAHEPTWRNPKHRQQWRSTLNTYVYPVIGDLPVGEVTTEHVLKIIEPIWATKTETAVRVRGRIETTLNWAKVRGHRTGDNPAAWKGHLDQTLPAPNTVREVKHHAALPFAAIHGFILELRQREGVAARALEVCILTGVRTDAIIRAQWTEFDFKERIWTVPGERSKRRAGQTTKPHRVPLTDRVIALIEQMRPVTGGGEFVFSSSRGIKPLSNMAMLNLRDDMGYGHITVHGFRSTFKDWVSEQTNHPQMVTEMALGHVVGDKVEAAYRRGDLFEKRVALMRDWEARCEPSTAAA